MLPKSPQKVSSLLLKKKKIFLFLWVKVGKQLILKTKKQKFKQKKVKKTKAISNSKLAGFLKELLKLLT